MDSATDWRRGVMDSETAKMELMNQDVRFDVLFLQFCNTFLLPGDHVNVTELALFRKYRFSRIQRQYENVWLWKDVNIGPHGRYIFNVPVPARPAHWMVTAFSMSPSLGFGMIPKTIEVQLFNRG